MVKILPIYLYGHPLLRKVAEPITLDYPDLSNLIAEMWRTMYSSEGVGLAAPQIGKSIRLIVIDAAGFEDPDCINFKRVLINPEILEKSDTLIPFSEGCLSLPGIHEEVKRSYSLTLRYMDEKGETHTETLSGKAAIVVQHEYDHLDGILFIDHLSQLRKRLLQGKLNSIRSGKAPCDYKVVVPHK